MIFPGVSGSLCHVVKCNLEKMDDFELPNDTINYDKGKNGLKWFQNNTKPNFGFVVQFTF